MGTHLRVLAECSARAIQWIPGNMIWSRWISKIFASLCFERKSSLSTGRIEDIREKMTNITFLLLQVGMSWLQPINSTIVPPCIVMEPAYSINHIWIHLLVEYICFSGHNVYRVTGNALDNIDTFSGVSKRDGLVNVEFWSAWYKRLLFCQAKHWFLHNSFNHMHVKRLWKAKAHAFTWELIDTWKASLVLISQSISRNTWPVSLSLVRNRCHLLLRLRVSRAAIVT